MRESEIQARVQVAAAQAGYTTWRNNTGMGWAGDARRLPDGSMLILNPRPLHAGLCVGSSDLIGLRPIVIGEHHIGTIIAQFVAMEVKTARGRVSNAQRQFLAHVQGMGGLSVVVRRPEDIP